MLESRVLLALIQLVLLINGIVFLFLYILYNLVVKLAAPFSVTQKRFTQKCLQMLYYRFFFLFSVHVYAF